MGNATSSFHEENLIIITLDLFLAGTETTSTTLRWALLYMAFYPEIQGEHVSGCPEPAPSAASWSVLPQRWEQKRAWQTGKMARMATRPCGLENGHIRQFLCHDCDGSQQYKYNTESLPSGNTKLAGKKVKLIVIVVNSRSELHPHLKFCSWGG